MAIYQRARPTRFGELVGQDHVTHLLQAALRRAAVGHAYLFSGPRGVGKTSMARLLAMALNCDLDDPAERPCGHCASCTLVRRGAHPDVRELDAASNNSVDDVRDLREKVALAPLRGGWRVWVLDEAHMLTRAAANALLKTLEEPPPHSVFVLATTESEKLPPTVVSRCQHFRFRRLSEQEILGKLERILSEAGVSAEGRALALVARTADGAMRDAESLLERLITSDGPITREAVEATLGLPAADRLWVLAVALVSGDLKMLLTGAAELYRDGFAPRTVSEQLGRTLRDALVRAVTGGEGPRLSVSEGALVRALHALDDAEERFTRRGDLYALEVALLRARAALVGPAASERDEDGADVRVDVQDLDGLRGFGDPLAVPAPGSAGAAPVDDQPAQALALAGGGAARSEAEGPSAGAEATPTVNRPRTPPRHPPGPRETGAAPGPRATAAFSWHHALSLAGPQLKAFLLPAQAEAEGGALHLRYSERHTFHFMQLTRREQELFDLVDQAGGAALEVLVEGPGGRLRRAVAHYERGEQPPGDRGKA